MNRRKAIAMSASEAAAFLEQEKTVICATNGRDGWPHLMPLYYVLRGGEVWAWTFAKSQKVRNLERDARATLQIEAGVNYHELRGVMLECRVEIHRDYGIVAAVGLEIAMRYGGGAAAQPEQAVAVVRKQAEKRVGLHFVEHRRATWDHRKLGGAY